MGDDAIHIYYNTRCVKEAVSGESVLVRQHCGDSLSGALEAACPSATTLYLKRRGRLSRSMSVLCGEYTKQYYIK